MTPPPVQPISISTTPLYTTQPIPMYTTTLEPHHLAAHLDDPRWRIVDCRFDLAKPAWGHTAYLDSHIPGAVYAHLDHDLSGPKTADNLGRHPIPALDSLHALFTRWGVTPDTQVVAYDSTGGMTAVRVWWLLHWLGHPRVAVLNGGWDAWLAHALPVAVGAEVAHPPADPPFAGVPQPGWTVDVAALPGAGAAATLIDARAGERYRGETEPIDPIAGHIPGARNRPWQANLDHANRFKPAATLRAEFESLLNGQPTDQTIVYCGSGVSACHHLLAMAVAGLPPGKLYPGSWSDYSARPGVAVALGDD